MAIRRKPIRRVTFRINEMLTLLICLYILIVTMQLWLLFGTINKALDQEHIAFAAYCAAGSAALFVCLLLLLRYVPLIPTGKILKGDEKDEEYEY